MWMDGATLPGGPCVASAVEYMINADSAASCSRTSCIDA